MALDSVHIKPVTPDPNAGQRYGSTHERAHKDRPAVKKEEERPRDRLEISADGRTSLIVNGASPDVDFARKALASVPPVSRDRFSELLARIESGYYRLPEVIWRISARLVHSLR